MNPLLEGHARFRKGYWRRHQKRFSILARDGQSPSAMVIACADSRVAPEVIFDCAPGEIFVARNVSNLVPPYAPDAAKHGTSAALEFAVTALKVGTIVVLGHSRCGGIRALMQGPGGDHGDFIASWMAIAAEARKRVCDAPDAAAADFDTLCGRCEHESIRVSLANLMTFPWIRARVEEGSLTLTGMHFDVQTGRVEMVAQTA
jgi:carbonic anhydrase